MVIDYTVEKTYDGYEQVDGYQITKIVDGYGEEPITIKLAETKKYRKLLAKLNLTLSNIDSIEGTDFWKEEYVAKRALALNYQQDIKLLCKKIDESDNDFFYDNYRKIY